MREREKEMERAGERGREGRSQESREGGMKRVRPAGTSSALATHATLSTLALSLCVLRATDKYTETENEWRKPAIFQTEIRRNAEASSDETSF